MKPSRHALQLVDASTLGPRMTERAYDDERIALGIWLADIGKRLDPPIHQHQPLI